MGKKRKAKRRHGGPRSCRKKQKRKPFLRNNSYSGFVVESQGGKTVRVSRVPLSVGPKSFFHDFVRSRTPALILGQPDDSKEWGLSKWLGDKGLKYMKSRAGSCKVKLEVRDKSGHFGTGLPKIEMPFGEYLDMLLEEKAPEKGEKVLEKGGKVLGKGEKIPGEGGKYLGKEERKKVLGRDGKGDGYYLTTQIEVIFQVIPLSFPHSLRIRLTSGWEKLIMVHWNGLIDYTPSKQTRSDGAHLIEVLKYKVRSATDRLATLKMSKNPDSESIQDTEALIERLEEECLEEELKEQEIITEEEEVRNENSVHPPSFSRIPAEALWRSLEMRGGLPASPGPGFSGICPGEMARPMVVEVKAGEMLYLPAGWFHEVTSFGEEVPETSEKIPETSGRNCKISEKDPEKRAKKEPGRDSASNVHMALNYWMYPPATKEYENPYEDGYWKSIFMTRGLWPKKSTP
ncbi:hypothetical protein AAMO2058_000816700 [Amorphochlora amoebiformis]